MAKAAAGTSVSSLPRRSLLPSASHASAAEQIWPVDVESKNLRMALVSDDGSNNLARNSMAFMMYTRPCQIIYTISDCLHMDQDISYAFHCSTLSLLPPDGPDMFHPPPVRVRCARVRGGGAVRDVRRYGGRGRQGPRVEVVVHVDVDDLGGYKNYSSSRHSGLNLSSWTQKYEYVYSSTTRSACHTQTLHPLFVDSSGGKVS